MTAVPLYYIWVVLFYESSEIHCFQIFRTLLMLPFSNIKTISCKVALILHLQLETKARNIFGVICVSDNK